MALLDAPIPEAAGVAVLCGVAFHQIIRPYEIDSRVWTLFFALQAAFTLLLVSYVVVGQHGIIASFGRTSVAAISFYSGLGASILLYRAFFHRLRRFPGPFTARLSKLYATINVASRFESHLDTEKLHNTYGDIVRTGPREISINRASAIPALYGPGMGCQKSPWYSQAGDDPNRVNLSCIRDDLLHKRRKKAWERGLGSRALAVYEPRIRVKVDLLMARIDAAGIGRPVDMTQLARYYGFDIMGEVGFSKDYEMLKSGNEHSAIKDLRGRLSLVAILGTIPWLMQMLTMMPQPAGSFEGFAQWCSRELQAKRKLVRDEKAEFTNQDPRDIMSWLLEAEYEHDQSAAPTAEAAEKDTILMVIAGSDTTGATLANAFWFLARHPAVYRKLQEHLGVAFPGGEGKWTYGKVKSIPYVDHIIQETLRLKPPGPDGMTRLTPPDGLQIDEVHIPGDTIVSVPTYLVQRDARYWGRDALEFRPERWEGLSTEKAPWIPFTRGQYGCPGRNLAFMELRIALSRIALRYDLAFPAGDDGKRFERETKVTFTVNLPPLPLVLTKRGD